MRKQQQPFEPPGDTSGAAAASTLAVSLLNQISEIPPIGGANKQGAVGEHDDNNSDHNRFFALPLDH